MDSRSLDISDVATIISNSLNGLSVLLLDLSRFLNNALPLLMLSVLFLEMLLLELLELSESGVGLGVLISGVGANNSLVEN